MAVLFVRCVAMNISVHMSVYAADVGEAEVTAAAPSELPRMHWAPPQEVPLWDINNCMLEDGQILISPEEEVPTYTCTHHCS